MTQSRRPAQAQRRRARTAGAEPLLCRGTANALLDLRLSAICRPGERFRKKTKPAMGNTTQSRRPAQAQRRRARTAGAEPILCRVTANALPDLRLSAICRPGERFRKKTKPATGNMTRY
ncbi:hypothetical protein B1A34_09240 [Klebsiella pneumoniae]|nr:hypothetical protein [Klebsiella pneumoniae]MBX4577254.1 hypothetical protein [Klebsiella pneumoniae]RIU62616.1 hypothetical protein D1618_20475 [Klebsiella pneumoniae]RIU84192.1 hypothetical protein D1620_03385 [Klebsiella pneumoniae]RYI18543.1 hypothetical protein EVY38_05585 [Klebsiella pneumoniae]